MSVSLSSHRDSSRRDEGDQDLTNQVPFDVHLGVCSSPGQHRWWGDACFARPFQSYQPREE